MIKTKTKKIYPDGTCIIEEKWEYEDSVEKRYSEKYNKNHIIKYKDYYQRRDSNVVQNCHLDDIFSAFEDYVEMINNLH